MFFHRRQLKKDEAEFEKTFDSYKNGRWYREWSPDNDGDDWSIIDLAKNRIPHQPQQVTSDTSITGLEVLAVFCTSVGILVAVGGLATLLILLKCNPELILSAIGFIAAAGCMGKAGNQARGITAWHLYAS